MNNSLKQAIASAELEGFTFTDEQKQFMSELVARIDNREITWDEAVKVIKERYNANKRRETDN